MKPVLAAGISIVNLALISYSIAIYKQNKKLLLTRNVMTFLTLGVIFDITATVCMIIGSAEGGVTLHGFIGYSSLVGMLIDTIVSYRKITSKGVGTGITVKFNNGSKIAYFYWVLAYITGALIIATRHVG